MLMAPFSFMGDMNKVYTLDAITRNLLLGKKCQPVQNIECGLRQSITQCVAWSGTETWSDHKQSNLGCFDCVCIR